MHKILVFWLVAFLALGQLVLGDQGGQPGGHNTAKDSYTQLNLDRYESNVYDNLSLTFTTGSHYPHLLSMDSRPS